MVHARGRVVPGVAACLIAACSLKPPLLPPPRKMSRKGRIPKLAIAEISAISPRPPAGGRKYSYFEKGKKGRRERAITGQKSCSNGRGETTWL